MFVDAAAKGKPKRRVAPVELYVDADADENPLADEWLHGDRAAVEAKLAAKGKR